MSDIFDDITEDDDIFDKVERADKKMLPAHTPGTIVAPQFETSPDPIRNREVMGISRPGAKIRKTPEETKQAAKDLGATAVKMVTGVTKGVTAGAVNPEKGTVGIPF